MPESYCVELEVSHPWNCEICLSAKPSGSCFNGSTKISHSGPTLTQSRTHGLNTIKCYTGLIFCIFGSGITIVNGSSQVGTAAQKAPLLLYNLRKDFFFPWHMVLQYVKYYLHWVSDRLARLSDSLLYDGEPPGLIQQNLHADNLIKIQVLKTMPFCIGKGFSICGRSQLAMHNDIAH